MTSVQLQRANEIERAIKSLESELDAWEENVRDGVVSPIMFRMGGRPIDFVPKKSLSEFKRACVTHLKNEIQELKSKFDKL